MCASVAAGVCTVYPWFTNTQGRYEVMAKPIYSEYFKNWRSVAVYLPPSYDENQYAQYSTLLMHDGQNLFNDSTSFGGRLVLRHVRCSPSHVGFLLSPCRSWRCAPTTTDLIMSEKISEVVIVGVYNTDNRIAEYTYGE